jgi:hypothetical protein
MNPDRINISALTTNTRIGNATVSRMVKKLLAQIVRHPIRFVRVTNPRGWSQRGLITGVMQTTDTSLSLVPPTHQSGEWSTVITGCSATRTSSSAMVPSFRRILVSILA